MAIGTIAVIAGPAYLANSATNIYTPPASTIATYISSIYVANVTGSAATYSLFRGATGGSAGGTQLVGTESVAAHTRATPLFFNPPLKMTSTDFLSGIASAGSALTVLVLGYQAVV